MEALSKFLSQNTTLIVAIIGLIGTLYTAYVGFRKYLDEKRSRNYEETIKQLFSINKSERLAAVATLGVYIESNLVYSHYISAMRFLKNLFQSKYYQKNSITILLNCIYTELDYDVLNAICSVLTQDRKNKEIQYIVDKLISINKNFFIQDYPLKGRLDYAKNILETGKNGITDKQSAVDIILNEQILNQIKEKNKVLEEYTERYNELSLHQQVSTDFLFMYLSEMSKIDETKHINLVFFQNVFNYGQFSRCNLRKCSIIKTALSVCTLIHIKIENLDLIEDSVFTFSALNNCLFKGGNIVNSLFDKMNLTHTVFENITFRNTYFFSSNLAYSEFNNVTGLEPIHFYKADFSKTKFDENFRIKLETELPLITDEVFTNYVKNSTLTIQRKEELLRSLSEVNENT